MIYDNVEKGRDVGDDLILIACALVSSPQPLHLLPASYAHDNLYFVGDGGEHITNYFR